MRFPTEKSKRVKACRLLGAQMLVWVKHEWRDAQSHSMRTYDGRTIACQLRRAPFVLGQAATCLHLGRLEFVPRGEDLQTTPPCSAL
jgi:hypothetical protein